MPYGMLESKNKDGTQWRMKTVYDLMRHHTALEVICGNCPNTAVLNNRFLSRHYGMMKVITELRFVCRRCFEGDNANFWGTDFRGKAVFYHAKFRHAEFIAAGFRCDANFLNTLFEWNASFEGSTFRTEALFVDTKFILSADFNSVTFISRASFEGAVFSAYAKFTRATFQGKADFSGSEMKGRTSFDGARFSAPPEYSTLSCMRGLAGMPCAGRTRPAISTSRWILPMPMRVAQPIIAYVTGTAGWVK